MRSPVRGYRTLTEQGSGSSPWGKAACFALALGLAASCSIAGLPFLSHWLLCAVAWSFVPLLQLASGFAVALVFGRRSDARRVLSLNLAGNGPHLLAALAAAGWSMLPVEGTALRYTPIVGVGAAAIAFGGIIQAGFYRVVLGRSRASAVLWVFGEWTLRIALILGWYALMNNLAPQFLGRR